MARVMSCAVYRWQYDLSVPGTNAATYATACEYTFGYGSGIRLQASRRLLAMTKAGISSKIGAQRRSLKHLFRMTGLPMLASVTRRPSKAAV